MHSFITKLNKTLTNQLQIIDLEESDIIKKAQKSMRCTSDFLAQLKAFISQYTFKDKQEEIEFFKEIKPELLAHLIYFVNIFNFESRRPTGSREVQEKYLRYELGKLTFFFNHHLDFYQYYRMKSSYLDEQYFMRGKENHNLCDDNLMCYIDPLFSTTHDYIVAKIIANDRLEVFLNTELEALSIKSANPNWGNVGTSEYNLRWTDSKTSLIELIYALCATGAINKGQCEIRELTALFEQIFNIRLTDVYRTFLEIKIRSNPTKFIDNLKDSLLNKIEEEL